MSSHAGAVRRPPRGCLVARLVSTGVSGASGGRGTSAGRECERRVLSGSERPSAPAFDPDAASKLRCVAAPPTARTASGPLRATIASTLTIVAAAIATARAAMAASRSEMPRLAHATGRGGK